MQISAHKWQIADPTSDGYSADGKGRSDIQMILL